jgi:hypothetical protein
LSSAPKQQNRRTLKKETTDKTAGRKSQAVEVNFISGPEG